MGRSGGFFLPGGLPGLLLGVVVVPSSDDDDDGA